MLIPDLSDFELNEELNIFFYIYSFIIKRITV